MAVTIDTPPLGEYVQFDPSDRFVKEFMLPKSRYVALVIGVQRNVQPILRIFNPYHAYQKQGPQLKVPDLTVEVPLFDRPVTMRLGGGSSGGGPKRPGHQKVRMEDVTIWCDEENTWGTWTPIQSKAR